MVPDNITLLPMPPRAPELNPVENVWQYLRQSWLGNRVFVSYNDIVAQCCRAWNYLIEPPWKIMSIGLRDCACRLGSTPIGITGARLSRRLSCT